MTDAPILPDWSPARSAATSEAAIVALRAHEARRPFAAPDLTNLEDADLLATQRQILRALETRPIRNFALDSAVVIEGPLARAAVRLRIDGDSWTLTTIEAALLAVRLRLDLELRGSELFADAFALASRQAEAKLDGLNRIGAALMIEEEG